ncbi:MAG TPA: protein kinase [Gemmatimonadales bacterium]|nr:protein kinase [Gemmatimonadales bacterium]
MTDPREQLQSGLSGSYALERELGRGGMATVYLAQDLKHDRPVALKVLHPELAHALGPERFQREIRLAARLQHPHILPVHDSGDTAGLLWFTMPYVRGESLRDRLRRDGTLPVEDAIRVAREAAQALQYAHDEGVVHRDVKPENILLAKDGSTLVADFGVARALSAAAGADPDTHLTETGSAIGTPTYMAPEQAVGQKAIDGRADQYSLAAVCYEMLTGSAPFTGTTVAALMAARFTTPVPSARGQRPEVPAAVDAALKRALALKPEDRFESMQAFVRALTGGASGFTPTHSQTVPVAAFRRLRRMPRARAVAVATGAALVLIAATLGGRALWRRTTATAPNVIRLAVLPFENLGDSADSYFADGVSDAVRGKLAALAGVQVIARGSSEQYRHTSKSPQQIGQELGVEYLLTGTVRYAKTPEGVNRVQVNPELVQVATSATRWGQPFDAALTDVFKVQADIAGRVAAALDVALGAKEQQDLAQRPTQNLAAYDAFLKGEAASQGMMLSDPAALRRAIPYYEQSVALDSTFGLAWAQLARSHATLFWLATPTPAVAQAAKRALERAQRYAPDRAATLLALGIYRGNVQRNWGQALAAYDAGLAREPASAELLTATARAELSLGRWNDAVAHLQRAQTLDPRSVSTLELLGRTLGFLQRWPEAQDAIDRGLALVPASLPLLLCKATYLVSKGNLAAAQAVVRNLPKEIDQSAAAAFFATYYDLYWLLDDAQQRLVLALPLSAFGDDPATWALTKAQLEHLRGDAVAARAWADSAQRAYAVQLRELPDDPQLHVLRGLALAYLGRRDEAIQEGQRGVSLAPISKEAWSGPYYEHQLARIYLVLGEPEKALDQLEPLLAMPSYLSPGWLRIDPNLAPLRDNPRFKKLVIAPDASP